MPKKLYIFGYIILFSLIVLFFLSYLKDKTIYIEAGPKGGFFDTSANLLKTRLKDYNIESEVINREDTIKIVEDVNDDNKNIHIGFVAQDLKGKQFKNVKALGSLILEPLFIFYRNDLELDSLADFKGLKLGVGPENSGTRLLAETILNLYDVNNENTTFIDKTHSIHFDMMENGTLDIGFFLLPANNQFIFKLGTNPNLEIFSLNASKALSRKFDYLYPEVVQAGGFDLKNNMASTKYVGTVASQKNNDSNFSQEQFGLPVIITDTSFILDYPSPPNEKLIFEVGRIDKTYKVEQKYLRLDKKSPEFDKAFYKAVRKNRDTRFLISNAGYKQWGDCEKIKTRTDYSLPTEQEYSIKSEFQLF